MMGQPCYALSLATDTTCCSTDGVGALIAPRLATRLLRAQALREGGLHGQKKHGPCLVSWILLLVLLLSVPLNLVCELGYPLALTSRRVTNRTHSTRFQSPRRMQRLMDVESAKSRKVRRVHGGPSMSSEQSYCGD